MNFQNRIILLELNINVEIKKYVLIEKIKNNEYNTPKRVFHSFAKKIIYFFFEVSELNIIFDCKYYLTIFLSINK